MHMYIENSTDDDTTVRVSPGDPPLPEARRPPYKEDDDTTVRVSPGGPPPPEGKGLKEVRWYLDPKETLRISVGKKLELKENGSGGYMITLKAQLQPKPRPRPRPKKQ